MRPRYRSSLGARERPVFCSSARFFCSGVPLLSGTRRASENSSRSARGAWCLTRINLLAGRESLRISSADSPLPPPLARLAAFSGVSIQSMASDAAINTSVLKACTASVSRGHSCPLQASGSLGCTSLPVMRPSWRSAKSMPEWLRREGSVVRSNSCSALPSELSSPGGGEGLGGELRRGARHAVRNLFSQVRDRWWQRICAASRARVCRSRALRWQGYRLALAFQASARCLTTSESMPCNEVAEIRNSKHWNDGLGRNHSGRWAAPPAPAMMTRSREQRSGHIRREDRGSMRRDDANLVRYTETGKHLDGAAHHRVVVAASSGSSTSGEASIARLYGHCSGRLQRRSAQSAHSF